MTEAQLLAEKLMLERYEKIDDLFKKIDEASRRSYTKQKEVKLYASKATIDQKEKYDPDRLSREKRMMKALKSKANLDLLSMKTIKHRILFHYPMDNINAFHPGTGNKAMSDVAHSGDFPKLQDMESGYKDLAAGPTRYKFRTIEVFDENRVFETIEELNLHYIRSTMEYDYWIKKGIDLFNVDQSK